MKKLLALVLLQHSRRHARVDGLDRLELSVLDALVVHAVDLDLERTQHAAEPRAFSEDLHRVGCPVAWLGLAVGDRPGPLARR